MRAVPLMVLAGLGAGCASVSPERGHDQVATIVDQRTGHKTRWDKGPPDDAQVAEWVRELTRRGLTRARAVEIALVNNPDLQATYEELGVSQADMVQAGLLRNPTFGADLGFRLNTGANDELRLSLVQDFLDLFVLPLRKEIAREQFQADTLRVANRALEVAADGREGVRLGAGERRAGRVPADRRRSDRRGRGAVTAAVRRGERERARSRHGGRAIQQAQLDLAREEIELLEARESVNRLLGLWGETTSWRFAETLPPLPSAEREARTPRVVRDEPAARRRGGAAAGGAALEGGRPGAQLAPRRAVSRSASTCTAIRTGPSCSDRTW